MPEKKKCHDCWQYHDYCSQCDCGGCYWFFNHPPPSLAESCEAFNHRYRENRKHRDEHGELMPKLQAFFEFLQSKPLKLTPKKAFMVIYELQEELRILPDSFEQCKNCWGLFDTYSEGFYLDDQYELKDGTPLPDKYWGHYCDEGCHPDIECHLA